MPPLRLSHLLAALLLSLILTFFHSTSSYNQGSLARHHTRQLQSRQSPPDCEYKGNPDLYGFGIRLGLYLQWTASVISKAWTPSLDSLRELLDADAIFLLAIFVATSIYSTGVLEPAHDIDILILLHMFFGDVYSVILEIAAKSTKMTPISAWGTRYRFIVIAGMSAYAVWFWFVGLETLPSAPCGSLAFLFAKVALRGNVKFFFQAVSVVNLFLWGCYGLLALIAFPFDPYQDYIIAQTIRKTRWWHYNRDDGAKDPRRILGLALSSVTTGHSAKLGMAFQTPEFFRIFKQDHPFIWRLITSVGSADGYHKQYKGKTRHDLRVGQSYLILNALVALFTIVAIELIIRWNHISNVYSLGSTSQIIPLVVGVGNLWKVVLSLFNDLLRDSSWNPQHQVFKLRDGTWMSFPFSKPARRLSSAGQLCRDENESKHVLAQTLNECYQEWLIPIDKSLKTVDKSESPTMMEKEHLGIISLDSFLLSLASNSRLPSKVDLSRFVADLFAFGQSKRLTVLAIMTKFENDEGNGYLRRELLLWPLTSQAASKLALFRKVDSDPSFHWRFWQTHKYDMKLGLAEWDDAKYDADHIIDRKKPLKKSRMSSSLAFSEESYAEDDTWRRVWALERKGADLERIAECLIKLLRKE